jgi:O-antigen/teichoic acid export membrane protein
MEWKLTHWLFAPARWALWLLGPGPRIWWVLFDDSKLSAVASLTLQTMGAILTALTARMLGQTNYGELVTLTTTTAWFGIVASYPTSSLVAHFRAEGLKSREAYERRCATGLWMSLGFGSVAMIAGLFLLKPFLRYYQVETLFWPGVMLCVALPLAAPGAYCLYLLQSFGRIALWSWINLAVAGIPIAALLVAATAFGPLTVAAYVVSFLTANTLTALLGLIVSARILGWRHLVHPDFSAALRMLQAGLGGFIAGASVTFAILAVNTLIAKCVSRVALGHYQLMTTIGGWVYAVVVSVSVPALSKWSMLAAEGRLQPLRRSIRLRQSGTGALASLAAALALVFAPTILQLIYGAAYRQEALLLRLSLPAWIALGFGSWYWIALTAMGHPGRVMSSNIVWGSVQFALAWVLIRWARLGSHGAMVAYAMAYLAWLATYEIVVRRTLREKQQELDASLL